MCRSFRATILSRYPLRRGGKEGTRRTGQGALRSRFHFGLSASRARSRVSLGPHPLLRPLAQQKKNSKKKLENPLPSPPQKKKNRPVPESPDDPTLREVRLSCPDATGLGCDAARVLLDCGLAVRRGDVSTDGRWCFMVFLVRAPLPPPSGPSPEPSEGARRQLERTWEALRRKLQAVAPQAAGVRPPGAGRRGRADAAATAGAAPRSLSAAPLLEKPRSSLSRDDENRSSLAATELAADSSLAAADASASAAAAASALPFVVRVAGAPDTRGTLHALVDALWAADLTVYRAEAGFAQRGATGGAGRREGKRGGGGGGGESASGRSSPPPPPPPPPRFVADSFWVLDNRGELPDPNRAAEVRAAVREALETQRRAEGAGGAREGEGRRQGSSPPPRATTPTKIVAVPVLRSEATCTIAPAALDDDDGDDRDGGTEGKGGPGGSSSSLLEGGGLGGPGSSPGGRGGSDSSHKTPPAAAPLSSQAPSPPRSFPPSRRSCANSAAAVPLRDAAAQRRRAAAAAAKGSSGGSFGGALSKAATSPERGGGVRLLEGELEKASPSAARASSSSAEEGEEGEERVEEIPERSSAPCAENPESAPAGSDDGEGSSDDEGSSDEFAWDDAVSVDLDNTTARSYSVVSVTCADRKGLVYDLMRTLKDVAVRVVREFFCPFFSLCEIAREKRRENLTFFYLGLVFPQTRNNRPTPASRSTTPRDWRTWTSSSPTAAAAAAAAFIKAASEAATAAATSTFSAAPPSPARRRTRAAASRTASWPRSCSSACARQRPCRCGSGSRRRRRKRKA